MDPKLLSVKSNVSSEYLLEEHVKQSMSTNIDSLETTVHHYFNTKSAVNFLTYYLELCVLKNDFLYPKSSVLEKIEKDWKIMLNKQFSEKISDDFIKEISYYWFQLVNKYAVPYSLKDLKLIVFYFKKTYFKDIGKLISKKK